MVFAATAAMRAAVAMICPARRQGGATFFGGFPNRPENTKNNVYHNNMLGVAAEGSSTAVGSITRCSNHIHKSRLLNDIQTYVNHNGIFSSLRTSFWRTESC